MSLQYVDAHDSRSADWLHGPAIYSILKLLYSRLLYIYIYIYTYTHMHTMYIYIYTHTYTYYLVYLLVVCFSDRTDTHAAELASQPPSQTPRSCVKLYNSITCINLYIYIYIYTHVDRTRINLCIYIYIYIYIHIYTCRQRERERAICHTSNNITL